VKPKKYKAKPLKNIIEKNFVPSSVKQNNIRQNLLKKINARVPVLAMRNKNTNAQKSIQQQQQLRQWSFLFYFLVVNFGNLATKEIRMDIFCHTFLSS
jgi:hypothetical protein